MPAILTRFGSVWHPFVPGFGTSAKFERQLPLRGANLTRRFLLAYGLPGKLPLIASAHIGPQYIEIPVTGDGGCLVLGTSRFNQPHRRGKKWFRYDAPDKKLLKDLKKTPKGA